MEPIEWTLGLATGLVLKSALEAGGGELTKKALEEAWPKVKEVFGRLSPAQQEKLKALPGDVIDGEVLEGPFQWDDAIHAVPEAEAKVKGDGELAAAIAALAAKLESLEVNGANINVQTSGEKSPAIGLVSGSSSVTIRYD